MFTVGVFQDIAWAERGVAALLAAGFPAETLSILAKPSPEAAALIAVQLGGAAEELEVGDVGPALGRGPLLEALRGSNEGLRAAGLARACRRAGFQAHDGQIFATLLSRGGILVGVLSVPRAADALAKLHSYGAGNAAIGAWVGRV